MDKDYTNLVALVLGIIIIVAAIFGFKDLSHRKEINKLLLEKSVQCTAEPLDLNLNNSISNSKRNVNNLVNSRSRANTASTGENNKDILGKTIPSTSNNVEKKTQNGTDFISDNKEISELQDEQGIESTTYSLSSNNSDNLQILARLIQSEAGDEPYEGKLAVGNVVLYRVQEDKSSIKDTILKKGQFDGVNTSNFTSEPSKESIEAAKEVLNGKKVIKDGYFFVNLKMASPSWADSDKFIVRIGDHWFFRKE